MSKYILELDSVSRGAILNTETNQWIALIETKRPDLGFEELQDVIDQVNLNDKEHEACGYCDTKTGLPTSLFNEKTRIFYSLSKKDGRGLLELSGPDGEAHWLIKYCPMCGHKLEEVAE